MTEAERQAELEAIRAAAAANSGTTKQDRMNSLVRQLDSVDKQILRLQDRKTHIEDELLALNAAQ
jgi:hypothetical protein